MYPMRAERLNKPPHVRVVLSKATKKMMSKPVDAVIAWNTHSMVHGSGRNDAAIAPVRPMRTPASGSKSASRTAE
jgi:hypothetical protein